MSEEIKEKERLRSLEVLSDVLNEFLEGRYDKFLLSFDKHLELTENEYYELLGNYDSSNGAKAFDAFTYDCDVIKNLRTRKCFQVTKTLVIKRDVENAGIYIIYSVEGYTNEEETDCGDNEA